MYLVDLYDEPLVLVAGPRIGSSARYLSMRKESKFPTTKLVPHRDSKSLFIAPRGVLGGGNSRITSGKSLSSLLLTGMAIAFASAANAETFLISPEKQICLAEVTVPAKFRIDRRDVVMQQAHATHEIVPARFTNRKEEMVVVDGVTRVKVTQAKMKKVKKEHLVHEASSRWVRGKKSTDPLISEGDRKDMIAAGYDLKKLPSGTCLYEYYREATYTEDPTRVLSREGSEVLSVVSHEYKDMTETVQVKASYTRLVEVPTVFKTSKLTLDTTTGKKRVMDRQVVESASFITRVEEPAEFKKIPVRRLIRDAEVKRETRQPEFITLNIPKELAAAKYTWVDDAKADDKRFGKPTGRAACHVAVPRKALSYERFVVAEEGKVEQESIPAEMRRIIIADRAADSTSTAIEIPAVIEMVETKVEVGTSSTRMQPVLCESHINSELVLSVQRALSARGYEPGPLDGKLGRGTQSALAQFQNDVSIPGGAFTLETLEKLGIEN